MVQQPQLLPFTGQSPGFTGIAGFGTSGLQNTSFENNGIAAGLPANFFRANTSLGSGSSAQLRTTAGNRQFNAIQVELRRRMSGGLVLGGSYQRQFHTLQNTWLSLRDAEPQYVDSTGGPVNAIKANWVYELPFGQGRKWGAGASAWKDLLIGGWEINGVLRTQSGDRFNYGNFRLVGVSEDEFADLFKFIAKRMPPGSSASTCSRAISSSSRSSRSSGRIPRTPAATQTASCRRESISRPRAAPTASSTLDGMCPGTKLRRIVEGPWYFRTDLSFAKRFNSGKGTQIEARMDVFNAFDNVNFVATTRNGNTLSAWEVIAAATDLNAAQDPGGRITQFSLRFNW